MSPPFTDEDRAFLTAILNNPAELTGWLVYADWLDDRDQPHRAEFLRLQVRLGQLDPADPGRPAEARRLLELRADIHPDWVAVFDRPALENCDGLFEFSCPKRWENLTATDDPRVRHCETCERDVYYSLTIREARDHAVRGRCVAVALGVRRSPGDLSPPPRPVEHVTMGRMLPAPPPPEKPPRRRWWKFW